MKQVLIIMLSFSLATVFNSCSNTSSMDLTTMMQDPKAQNEVMDMICNDHKLMTNMLAHMQKSEHAMRMMMQNDSMMNMMMRNESMMHQMMNMMHNDSSMCRMMSSMMVNDDRMRNMMHSMMNQQNEPGMQSGKPSSHDNHNH